MLNWRAADSMNSGEQQWIEPDVEAAWFAEIERRLVDVDSGTVELIPWDDVRSELFGESEWRE